MGHSKVFRAPCRVHIPRQIIPYLLCLFCFNSSVVLPLSIQLHLFAVSTGRRAKFARTDILLAFLTHALSPSSCVLVVSSFRQWLTFQRRLLLLLLLLWQLIRYNIGLINRSIRPAAIRADKLPAALDASRIGSCLVLRSDC